MDGDPSVDNIIGNLLTKTRKKTRNPGGKKELKEKKQSLHAYLLCAIKALSRARKSGIWGEGEKREKGRGEEKREAKGGQRKVFIRRQYGTYHTSYVPRAYAKNTITRTTSLR